jgi:glycogen operon protein
VQVVLNGAAIPVPDMRGNTITDDTFLIIFHAHPEPREITLPAAPWGPHWRHVLDTERGFTEPATAQRLDGGAKVQIAGRSLWVFRRES